MSIDEYVKNVKEGFVTVGVNAAMTAIVSAVPFLGAPIVRKVVKFIVEKILTKVVDAAEMQIFFTYIDMRTNKQAEDFLEAARLNRLAQQMNDPELKIEAEKRLIDKFRAFAKLAN